MKHKDFILEKLSSNYYQLIFNYYNSNKEHLEPWEPTRTDNYYTLDFHMQRTDNRLELMNKGKAMHFILLNNLKSEIIGVCNYTNINKSQCWLGYSMSRNYQSLGYMYQAVINSNDYMFNKYHISKIYAGIITRNKRSTKLINRLSFVATGKNKKMEINSNIEELEIYYLNKPTAPTLSST